jgi:hypothetical protein
MSLVNGNSKSNNEFDFNIKIGTNLFTSTNGFCFNSTKEIEDYIIAIKKVDPRVSFLLTDFCKKRDLSESFIELFKDEVSWVNISLYNDKLSENFIEKYKKDLRIEWLVERYNFSLDFLIRNLDEIKLYDLKLNTVIDKKTKKKFLEYCKLIK